MSQILEWSALKEWAVVVRAMEEGKQFVLFRKGGILDGTFSIENNTFLLFPTYEHQSRKYVKDEYQHFFNEEEVTIRSAASIESSFESNSREILLRLSRYHIYNDDFIDYRMSWNKDKPVSVLLVRTYMLEKPLTIDMQPEYSGCRSWIRLKNEAKIGRAVTDDQRFRQVKSEIEAILR